MNGVIEFLKNYIWQNGFETLSENPFDVYKAMVRDGKDRHAIDQKTARLVLITLMSKTHEIAFKGGSADKLIDHIQSEHYLNRKASEDLASMYLELFSEENRKSWNEAKEEGFEEFCQEEWTIEWQGSCYWHTKHGGNFPCNAEASLVIAVQDKEMLHSHLSMELKTNPFLSADDIYRIIADEVRSNLDNDMEEYCNADDYYEPYFDEFIGEGTCDSENEWESWGLEIVEFTGSGDVDFRP